MYCGQLSLCIGAVVIRLLKSIKKIAGLDTCNISITPAVFVAGYIAGLSLTGRSPIGTGLVTAAVIVARGAILAVVMVFGHFMVIFVFKTSKYQNNYHMGDKHRFRRASA